MYAYFSIQDIRLRGVVSKVGTKRGFSAPTDSLRFYAASRWALPRETAHPQNRRSVLLIGEVTQRGTKGEYNTFCKPNAQHLCTDTGMYVLMGSMQ